MINLAYIEKQLGIHVKINGERETGKFAVVCICGSPTVEFYDEHKSAATSSFLANLGFCSNKYCRKEHRLMERHFNDK